MSIAERTRTIRFSERRRQGRGALRVLLALLFSVTGLVTVWAQSSYFDSSDELNRFVADLVTRTVAQYGGLRADQLAVTLVDLQTERPTAGQHRGDVLIYPASVVKIFYEAMAYHRIDDEQRNISAEFHRAMVDMIRYSNNDATAYVVDWDTDTTSGPELPPDEFQTWSLQRNAVNRYFRDLGYGSINTNQKPWSFGPYGRERDYVRTAGSNALTTNATARLIHEIYSGRFVKAQASAKLLGLMKRDLTAPFRSGMDDQTFGFIGRSLPPGSLLWSKAGWTSVYRHDAALVTLPTGQSYILVIFTTGHYGQPQIIHTMSRWVVEYMQERGATSKIATARAPRLAERVQRSAGNGAGVALGGPERYWSPPTTCGAHTYYNTTPTSSPEAALNYAVVPAPADREGQRVQVRVWVPACDGNAKVSYYIHTGDTDYGPYVVDQGPLADEFANVGPVITLSGNSYLYFFDYAPESGTIVLSDVDWRVQ